MSGSKEIKATSVLHVTDSEVSERHFYPLVIQVPDVGKILVEEADPRKAETMVADEMYGYKVLIQTFKELQELKDPRVEAVLKRNQVRYEEPGW